MLWADVSITQINEMFKLFSQSVENLANRCYDATMNTLTDKELITLLGGPTVLSKKLGFSSPQRVHNWVYRGIPASIKLAYPKLFLNKRIKK